MKLGNSVDIRLEATELPKVEPYTVVELSLIHIYNDTPVQPQLERSERRTQWVRLHKNYAEVKRLWVMTKAVELLT